MKIKPIKTKDLFASIKNYNDHYTFDCSSLTGTYVFFTFIYVSWTCTYSSLSSSYSSLSSSYSSFPSTYSLVIWGIGKDLLFSGSFISFLLSFSVLKFDLTYSPYFFSLSLISFIRYSSYCCLSSIYYLGAALTYLYQLDL